MPDDHTALLEAVRAGDARTVEQILRREPRLVDARDEQGVPALLVALYHRHDDVRDTLLAAGAPIGVLEAAALNRGDRLRELLAADPDAVNARSPDGHSALGYACFFGGLEAVHILLAAGADPNAPAQNPMRVAPLHSAAAMGALESARLLLDAGADPNARQQGGATALHTAAHTDDVELARLLLDRGADPGITDDQGRDARAIATARGSARVSGLLETK
jgi:ankyrin repeat protein